MKLEKRSELFSAGYYNTGNTGFLELWDFSDANLSMENRVKAVSQVASVCFGNNGLKPNFKLYDKLSRESIGLPSSSFEFIPVILNEHKINLLDSHFRVVMQNFYGLLKTGSEWNYKDFVPNVVRYGYVFVDKGKQYILTNLRALMYDLEFIQKNITSKHLPSVDDKYWLNTKEEVETYIKKLFVVFRVKATIRDFRQLFRHRRAFQQELSRRYTSGEKVPFEFRYNLEMAKYFADRLIKRDEEAVDMYFEAVENGFKKEDARDLLPVSLYSIAWIGFYPDGYANFLNLRTKSSAQKAIREIAEKMRDFKQIY